MSEFNRRLQPNKEPSKADINIIEKLLGTKAAVKYKGTGEGSESAKDVGYTPSVKDLSDVSKAKIASKEFEKNPEKNIAESKRQMSEWAKKSEVDEAYIADHVTYEPNGDIIWEGDCDFSSKENITNFPPNLKEVRGTLDIRYTNIESLKGCPSSVKELNCSGANIDSLEGCPSSVTELYCSYTKIESLVGCPSSVTNLVCSSCPSLREIPSGLHNDLVILLIKSQKELAADAETKGYKVTYF